MLNYEDFRKNPIKYMVFVSLGVISSLSYMILNGKDAEKKQESMRADIERTRADKAERKQEKTDSINHELYQILGAKKVIDELKDKK